MKIIVAEKPSVGRAYADILGVTDAKDGYMESEEWIVTWAVGHLVSLSYPEKYDEKYAKWNIADLPFLPEKYKYEVIKDVKKQFEIIKKLFNRSDIDVIFYAGDSGREGLYIMALIRMLSGHNPGATEKVVWIDSQTKAEVLRGIRDAKPLSAYKNLSDSGYMRAIEDFAVGINFSRALSVLYGRILNNAIASTKYIPISVGRVMTFVLGMIVQREYEIAAFTPTPFYKVQSLIEVDGEHFIAEWRASEKTQAELGPKMYQNNGFLKEEDANAFISKLSNEIIIKNVSKTVEKKNAPLLFNLAELQSECSKRFKISPSKTLEVAQSLYEKKLTTYPRTDARVLTTAIAGEIEKNIKGLATAAIPERLKEAAMKILSDSKYIGLDKTRYVDDTKVTDHYAVIPTGETANYASLSELEKNVYQLILKRFLAIFLPPAEYAKIAVEETAGTESFFYTGKALSKKGYLELYQDEEKEKEERKQLLLAQKLSEGSIYEGGYQTKRGETQPPKRYTSGSIILAMENAGKLIEEEELREQIKSSGIGTSATRAETIEKLCRLLYIRIDSKTQVIYPQSLGYMVYEVVRLTLPNMLSAKMTASWEKGLNEIVDGSVTREDYHNKLNTYIERQMGILRGNDKTEEIKKVISPYAVKGASREIGKELTLLCPVCKSPLRVSKYGYMCSAYDKESGCKFAIGEIAGIMLKESDVEKLLSAGITDIIKGFKSKSGKKFEAKIKIGEGGKLSFDFPERELDKETLYLCRCKKPLTEKMYTYECECGVKFSKEVAGYKLSEGDIKALMEGKETEVINGLKAKSGNTFSAALKYDDENGLQYVFPERETGSESKVISKIECKYCNKPIVVERWNYTCTCGLKIPRELCSKTITESMLSDLMKKGKTAKMTGYRSKAGKNFSAVLELSGKEVKFKF